VIDLEIWGSGDVEIELRIYLVIGLVIVVTVG
jgi:hypothetical protein